MIPLRTLILGCGNIAGAFDAARPGADSAPLTHAGAYRRDGRFELAACVEPDDRRRLDFMERWGVPAGFRSIEELGNAPDKFDVISVCSPTPRHAQDLEAVLRLHPKLVFCEKPVTDSASRTEVLVGQFRQAGIPLAVNYTRRWDPAVADLQAGIREGRWGKLRAAVGYYNKGILNNGSHMLDLLRLLLGPLDLVAVGRPTDDFSSDDPSIPALLETAGGVPVQLACGHAADFALFELQLIFSNAVIAMEDGGMSWRERGVAGSSLFPGYRAPGEGVMRAGSFAQAMLLAIDNIFRAIQHGEPLASTGESSLHAERLCERVRRP